MPLNRQIPAYPGKPTGVVTLGPTALLGSTHLLSHHLGILVRLTFRRNDIWRSRWAAGGSAGVDALAEKPVTTQASWVSAAVARVRQWVSANRTAAEARTSSRSDTIES